MIAAEERAMRYYYTSNFSTYKMAMRAYIRSSWSRRVRFHIWMWGLLVSGVVLFLMLSFSPNIGRTAQDFCLPIAFGLIAGGAVTPLIRPLQLQRVYRAWNGELQNNKEIYVEVDVPVLLSGIESEREGKYQRGAFCNVIENDEIVLLFLNKKKFIYFSKASLPQAFFDELHAWLALPGAPPPC
jgi:hypothetical protein